MKSILIGVLIVCITSLVIAGLLGPTLIAHLVCILVLLGGGILLVGWSYLLQWKTNVNSIRKIVGWIIRIVGSGICIIMFLLVGLDILPVPLPVKVFIALGTFPGFLPILLYCTDRFLINCSQTPQSTQVKQQPKPLESLDPWIPAPKVQVEKEEKPIPEIWKKSLVKV